MLNLIIALHIAQKHIKPSLNKMRTSTTGSINMQPIEKNPVKMSLKLLGPEKNDVLPWPKAELNSKQSQINVHFSIFKHSFLRKSSTWVAGN